MGMKEVFEQNPNRRYIMFGGKGGLGKTTFSAATAYWLAKQGKKVLVFSVDPQASLSDIFQQDIFGKGFQELAPLINLGADGAAEMTEKLRAISLRLGMQSAHEH